jgi:protein-disulfide isomerase
MTEGARARLTPPVSERDHVQGPATAPVTLVEYGDHECPYCRAAVPIVQELQRLLGDQLRFVFRHFPLTNVHPRAQHAAEAAEAAAAQGQFWEMHASLFQHQQALDHEHLVRYAADLGLDTERFQQALAEHSYADRVREDYGSAIESSVDGTPTFYLDGVRYDEPVGLRQLLAAIRRAHPEVVREGAERVAQRRIPRVVWRRSQLRPRAR